MYFGEIFQERPGPHKQNGGEFHNSNVPIKHLLQASLVDMGYDNYGNVNQNDIVVQVQEQEIPHHGCTHLEGTLPNAHILRGLPEQAVHAHPWEDLIYFLCVALPEVVANPECEDDDRW